MDFVVIDADGKSQHVEFLNFNEVFISGAILPLKDLEDEKKMSVRCGHLGPILSWRIFGYEEGFLVIWVFTGVADFCCLNLANKYKKIYDMFFEKTRAFVKVYKKGCHLLASSKDYHIKINEDEIGKDYPLSAYYKSWMEETDECLILDSVMEEMNYVGNVLHNWSFYNLDMRLICLELLPVRPCTKIDVTTYGSGIVTCNDGAGFYLDGDSEQPSIVKDVDGLPVFLSAIKEWKIEYGSSIMFISIQTDIAWYRFEAPAKQYEPWYRLVLKTTRVGVAIIYILKENACLLYVNVIQKLCKYEKDHVAFISFKEILQT